MSAANALLATRISRATIRSALREPSKRADSQECPWYSPAPMDAEPS